MNRLHRRLCASTYWTGVVEAEILPRVLDGVDLGLHALEIGPGAGAATRVLRRRVEHLTCVEIDSDLAASLASRMAGHNVTVLCEDATRMSLPDATFDAALSLTMLHHVPSAALQDRLLAEVARVLRPGGTFAGFDAVSGPLFRMLHFFDTMVPIDPGTFADRLTLAGFRDIHIDVHSRGFAFHAYTPRGSSRSSRKNAESSERFRNPDFR